MKKVKLIPHSRKPIAQCIECLEHFLLDDGDEYSYRYSRFRFVCPKCNKDVSGFLYFISEDFIVLID